MEETQKKELIIHPPEMIVKMGVVALGALALFLLILAISAIKEYRFIGSGVAATNTINVSGDGEVFAAPDTAQFTVSVSEQAKVAKDAQEAATQKGNAIVAFLKSAGIEDKDVQATGYSVAPEFDWVQQACVASYCPGGKQVFRDYIVSETITVKVHAIEKAGDILTGVVAAGAKNVDGPNYTIDKEDDLKAQARDMAISKAKAKAEVLARSLGVSLVRVVGFSENEGGQPMYYAKAMSLDSSMAGQAAPAPSLPAGQNKISSSVSVTYEIR